MATKDQIETIYDLFLVHSSDDVEKARRIDEALKENGLKTYAHYRSGDDNKHDADGFFIGKFVVDNISYAIEKSRIVLILVTPSALESGWVTYEIILSIERSLRQDSMCVRLVFMELNEEQIRKFKTGDLEYIPDFVLDFDKKSWITDLVAKIKEPNPKLADVLPCGNVAHGLVFNYFAGFLRNILPVMIQTIKESPYQNMLPKFIIVIPASCRVVPLPGNYGDVVIQKMNKALEIKVAHGDKFRSFNLTVYSITKGEQTYHFTGECPFIIGTMYKITSFAKVGPSFLKFQVERFRKTLMELVNHRGNLDCNDTVSFVNFDDTSDSNTTLGSSLWAAIETSLEETLSEENGVKLVRKLGTINDMSSSGKKYFATITNEDTQTDNSTAEDISNFLMEKQVQFTNGGGNLELQVLDQAQWNIFVLSKDIYKNQHLMAQLTSALHQSLDSDQIQVIPIVTKETDIKDIPEHLKCVTLLEEKEDGSHLRHMWNIMKDKPRTMKENLPSGPVHQGLAYAYMVNYLVIALDGKTADGKVFRERFEDALQKYKVNCPCVPRVFLIVPESCSFPAPGTQFINERHIGELEPVVVGVREYCLQMYELTMKDGSKVCYAREYATPAISLHEMAHKYPFAGMNTDQMKVQAQEFVKLCRKITQDESFKTHIGDIKEKCVLVYFNDSIEEMPNALEREIQTFLDAGEVIRPTQTE